MRLIDMIKQNAAPQDVEQYLSRSAELSSELAGLDPNSNTNTGMTALQIAVEKGNFKTVQVLLSFDASIDAKIGNKNVVEYSKELMEKNPENERRKIYALLKSRGKWQSTAAKTQGVLFARSMKTIVDAVDKIKGAVNKIGLLFLGITGEGKSTFINYLTGVDYKKGEKKRGQFQIVPTSSEIAKVGNTTTSETFLPQIVELKNQTQVLVDLPGFEDTRGTAEEICAAATISMLTKQLNSIQSILLVCSWNTLADTRMVNYRQAAYNIGGMISNDPKTAENVILLVTKPYGSQCEISLSDVKETLTQLSKDEKWDKLSDVKREDVDEDTWKKYCLKKVTEALLSHEEHIVMADVLTSDARTAFHKTVGTLSGKAKKPDQFDFTNYSRFMTQFKLVMENMIINYNDLARRHKSQEEKLQSVQNSIKELEAEKNELEDSIAKSEKQKNEPFTAESFDNKILEEKKKVAELRNKMLSHAEILRRAELEATVKGAQLSSFEKSGEKLIDRVTGAWVCEKTEDRNETKVNYGEVIDVPGRGRYQVVDIKKELIPGKETTVSEPVRYPSSVPISRFLDRSQGGTFEAPGFTTGTLMLNGTFKSAKGARGSVSLNVELYGDSKDFPETKEKINQLELAAKDAENALSRAKSDSIPQEAADEASERLRKLELEKIAAVGNHERTKEICDMQITFNQAQLKKVREKFDELGKQRSAEENELSDLNLQLEVNSDLFDKLREIIKVMNFKGNVIDQFMELSSQKPKTDKIPMNESVPDKLPLVLV